MFEACIRKKLMLTREELCLTYRSASVCAEKLAHFDQNGEGYLEESEFEAEYW